MQSFQVGVKTEFIRSIFAALVILSMLTVVTAESFAQEQAVTQTAPEQEMVKVILRFRQKGSGVVVRRTEASIGDQKFQAAPDGTIALDAEASATLRFSRFGYKPMEVKVSNLLDQARARLESEPAEGQIELRVDIFLEPALGGDDTVIVTGKKRHGVSKQVISVEEARRVAPGGDPGQVTKLMPGVQRSAFGSQVVIRGSAPADSKYYIDDLEVPFVYHGVGQYTVLPTPLIEDVEFSAGGFGAEYGDATGGIIKVRSKSNLVERPLSIFTVNFPIFSSAYHERPVGENASLSLSVRRSYLDLILDAVLPKDSGLTIVPYFSDYVALYNREYEDGRGRLISIASTDGLKVVFPGDAAQDEGGSARFSIFNYYGILGYERTRNLTSGWSLMTTPQVQFFKLNFRVIDNKLKLKVWSLSLPTELTWRPNQSDKFYFGVDPRVDIADVYFDAIRFDRDDPFFDPEEAPREEGSEKNTARGGAAWVSMEKKVGDWLLIPGIRGYYNAQTKKTIADPRFSGRWNFLPEHAFKFAFGMFSKNPEPGEASNSFGNPDLGFERATHLVAGVESKWGDRWTSDLQFFNNRSKDLVRADTEKRYVNAAQIESHGAELLVRRNLTERLFGWFSYTWSKNRARESADGEWHAAEYDQTHVVNLAGNYRLTALWEVGGRYNYHTGDTFTEKGNAVYNANLDKYQPRQGDMDLYAARLPNYNEISIFGGREFLWDTWKMNARFGIEYLWTERQALGVDYNYDYTEKEYLNGVPPIPYLEIQATL